MSKTNLKVKEPDDLTAAIDEAAAASKKLRIAEDAFAKRFPFDHRLALGDMLGTVLVDKTRDNNDPVAARHSLSAELLEQLQPLFELRAAAARATREVERVRMRIEASISETDRRSALAAAMKEASAATETATKFREAVARADRAVSDAQRLHSEAAQAVTDAVAEQARLREQALEQGHPAGRDSAVQEARRQVDAATDELAAASAAAAALRSKLAIATEQLKSAQLAIDTTARSVIATALPGLLAEARVVQAELDGRRQVLWTLAEYAPAMLKDEVLEYLGDKVFTYGDDGAAAEDHPHVQPYLAALYQLQLDADAPLPKA